MTYRASNYSNMTFILYVVKEWLSYSVTSASKTLPSLKARAVQIIAIPPPIAATPPKPSPKTCVSPVNPQAQNISPAR